MSFVPRCAVGAPPSVGDSGKETFVRHSWKKESERKTSRKIVSLRVPGTVDCQKPSSAPDVIRVCQERYEEKKPRRKFNRVGFVIVPDSSDFGAPEKRQSFEPSTSSSVPSIKRCSLDEIKAVNCPLERIARKTKGKNPEKDRERTQCGGELRKTPVRHSVAPRTRVRTGVAT